MKTCFSIICIFCIFFSGVLAQDASVLREKKIRELLLELSAKVQDLESIFLVPDNMHIENGDASYALVELEKIQFLIKKLEGRIENMEYQMSLELRVIDKLNQELSSIIGEEGSITGLGVKEKKEMVDQESDDSLSGQVLFEQDESFSELDAMQLGKTLLENDNFAEASNNYKNFIENYPNSSFLPEAFFLLAESQYKMAEWKNAANSYLEGFSLRPNGIFAPPALFGLAISLGALKEFEQACLTLEEVQLRFPSQDVIAEQEIVEAKVLLNCHY